MGFKGGRASGVRREILAIKASGESPNKQTDGLEECSPLALVLWEQPHLTSCGVRKELPSQAHCREGRKETKEGGHPHGVGLAGQALPPYSGKRNQGTWQDLFQAILSSQSAPQSKPLNWLGGKVRGALQA